MKSHSGAISYDPKVQKSTLLQQFLPGKMLKYTLKGLDRICKKKKKKTDAFEASPAAGHATARLVFGNTTAISSQGRVFANGTFVFGDLHRDWDAATASVASVVTPTSRWVEFL